MDERRKKGRISIDLKIIACNPSIHPDSRIINLSNTGAFIATSKPLSDNTEVAIHFQLPGDPEIIAIEAQVVWTKTVSEAAKSGMGLHFTNILPEHQKNLAAFIKENNQQNGSQK